MEKPLHVLLVDDDPDDRLLVTRELQRALPDVRTTEIANAEQLVAAMEAPFDLVVTDFQLRWSNGIEVLRTVKARYPDRPVIMFTATGSQEIAVEAMKSGLDDYLIKAPAHYVRIPVAVQTVLERAENRRERREAAAERERLTAELRERVAELAERDRRKDEFLAVLGHELRNPLGALSNALFVLDRTPDLDARTRRQVDISLRQVRQLTRLVNDLLDVARVTRGQIELRTTELDLRSAAEDAVETVRPLAEARQQALSVCLPAEPVRVEGDAARLTQVIANLLDNAAKYTEPGGKIDLSVEAEEAAAVVRVRDTGVGIAPELLPEAFELFSQVSRSSTQTEGGLGIGLYLVCRLVELHGGRVEAHSAGRGQGSEFVVRLPRSGAG